MKKYFFGLVNLLVVAGFLISNNSVFAADNPYACAAKPTMQQGLSNPGTCVQAVQWYLEPGNTSPSGDFDASLTAKVKAWQTAHGLTPDGIVGPNTWSSFTCTTWDKGTGPNTGTCKDVVANVNSNASADCGKLEKNFLDFGGSVPGPLTNGCYSAGEAVSKATKLGFTLVGLLAVLAIVIGGYRYIMSRGDEKAASSGKNTIKWAIIGLVLVLFAYALVTIATRLLMTNQIF